MFIFLKDYNICPRLFTKSTAFLLFHDLIETPLDEILKNDH